MKKILIAADSFKDALPAAEVCRAIERGILNARADVQTICFPLADGGEGTYDVLAEHLHLQRIETDTCDALKRSIRAPYGLAADGQTAFVELAQTAGLQLLLPEERNPLHTTTLGVGIQISDARQKGINRLVLAIGGSATNDAGMGIATALGWKFLHRSGKSLEPVGASLHLVAQIVPPPQPAHLPEVQVICDVVNPLYGPAGAACVYGPQKGADAEVVSTLDKGLQHFAGIVENSPWFTPLPVSPALMPGAGAAGGVGYGAMIFLNAQLRRGIDLVLEMTRFEEQLRNADLVITGEGKLDAQTAHGKLIQGICRRAAAFGVPVIALCGKVDANAEQIREIGLLDAWSINPPGETDLAMLLKNTAGNLEKTAARLGRSMNQSSSSI